MKWIYLLAAAALIMSGWCQKSFGTEPKQKKDYAVLIHGMSRTHLSMKLMEMGLKRDGYTVVNIRYPSNLKPIDELSEHLARSLADACPDPTRKIHFVTHSLGGLVVRAYMATAPDITIGRVVMLAPPNRGSEVADKLKHRILYRLWSGPAGQELGTLETDTPRRLGPVNFELGIIAGDVCLNPLLGSHFDGANDGKVSVKNARVDGMKELRVMHVSHTWIMTRKAVIAQCRQFLAAGHFSPAACDS